MTRQQFTDACFDLGLGISVEDMQRLCEVLDEAEDNRIDYYLVLTTLDLSRPLDPKDPDNDGKSPNKRAPPKRRTDLRNRGRKGRNFLKLPLCWSIGVACHLLRKILQGLRAAPTAIRIVGLELREYSQ